MNVSIRSMTENDLDKVIEFEKHIFKDAWSPEMIRAELNSDFYKHPLILEYEKQICGYAFIWAFNNEVHINNFAILPQYRRQGLGFRLLTLILDAFHDFKHYFLEVRKSNLAAIRLYKKCGFDIIEIRKKYYSDNEDALVMYKKF